MNQYMPNLESIIQVKKNIIDVNYPQNILFGFEYEVKNSISKKKGKVTVYFHDCLSEVKAQTIAASYYPFKKMVDSKTSFAIIGLFYPHDKDGYEPDRIFSKVGIGKYVLNNIISDIKRIDYDVIFVNSNIDAMNFYRNNGFKEIDKSNSMYKYL